jgi:hypothetical protein
LAAPPRMFIGGFETLPVQESLRLCSVRPFSDGEATFAGSVPLPPDPYVPQSRAACGAAAPHIIPIVTAGARSSRRNNMAQSPQRRTRIVPHISAAEIRVKCGNVEAARISWRKRPVSRSFIDGSLGKVGFRCQPDSRNHRAMKLWALLEKTPRQMIGFPAQWLMELEVEGLTGRRTEVVSKS